jgi:hypothetical protein
MPRQSFIQKLILYKYVAVGDELRYVHSVSGETLLSGQVTEDGLAVEGQVGLCTLHKFEKLAGGYKIKQPAKYTLLPCGKSVEDAMAEIGVRQMQEKKKPKHGKGGKSRKKSEEHIVDSVQSLLVEDEHNSLCQYCGLGGDLMCCETCPTVAHAGCCGLKREPEKEAMWYCPACTCSVCGKYLDQSLEQYRGALLIPPADAQRYVDILDPMVYKRLVLGRQHLSSTKEPERAVEEIIKKSKQKDQDEPISCAEENDKMNTECKAEENVVLDVDMLEAEPRDTRHQQYGIIFSGSGIRLHPSCAKQCHDHVERGTPFCSDDEMAVLKGLVHLCHKGALSISRYACGSRVSFQIIHAAAASGQTAYGISPKYTPAQMLSLRKILSACWAVIKDSYEVIWDSRTGVNLAPMMLQGASKLPFLDYSGMFVAPLFINSIVVSVACFRILGTDVAELPIIATRRDLRGKRAASTLLARLDHELHKLGVKSIMTQATYDCFTPYMPSLNPPGEPLPTPSNQVFGFKSPRKECVDKVISCGGLIIPGVTWVEKETGQALNWAVWESKLHEVNLELNRSVDEKSRRQLLMIKACKEKSAQNNKTTTEDVQTNTLKRGDRMKSQRDGQVDVHDVPTIDPVVGALVADMISNSVHGRTDQKKD